MNRDVLPSRVWAFDLTVCVVGGVLLIMDYMGRLCQNEKEVPFLG